MNRRFLASVAALAVAVVVASPAFAGGGGGGSKSKVNVRVLNLTDTAASVRVYNSKPGAFRTLSSGAKSQWKVNKGRYFVDDGFSPTSFNTGGAKTTYIMITANGPEPATGKF